jgi:hypothetical protein
LLTVACFYLDVKWRKGSPCRKAVFVPDVTPANGQDSGVRFNYSDSSAVLPINERHDRSITTVLGIPRFCICAGI